MGDETTAKVWLYEAGDWQLADDPISWADGDDVMEKYAEAGYSEFGSPATWFLAFGLNSEDNPGYGAQFTLYVRDARPQCLIGIEGWIGSNRAVYAARFPDGRRRRRLPMRAFRDGHDGSRDHGTRLP